MGCRPAEEAAREVTRHVHLRVIDDVHERAAPGPAHEVVRQIVAGVAPEPQ
jgi:hypothetical protein